MKRQNIFTTWGKLAPKHQRLISSRIKKLGIKPVQVTYNSRLYKQLKLGSGYLTNVMFRRGVIYFSADADVQDIAHDCGHAMTLTPSQRLKFWENDYAVVWRLEEVS